MKILCFTQTFPYIYFIQFSHYIAWDHKGVRRLLTQVFDMTALIYINYSVWIHHVQ